jgi:hypothetical protein
MSQRLTIDLNQNPEVKNLVSDMEVSDRVKLETTIVSKDDQTLVVELEEASEGSEPEANETTETEPVPGDEVDSPAMAVATGKVKV